MEYVASLFGKEACKAIVTPIAQLNADAANNSTTLVIFCNTEFVRSLCEALRHIAFKLQLTDVVQMSDMYVNQEDVTFSNVQASVTKAHKNQETTDVINYVVCSFMASHDASITILKKKLDTLTLTLNNNNHNNNCFVTTVVSCSKVSTRVLPPSPPTTAAASTDSDEDEDDESSSATTTSDSDLYAITRKASTIPVSEVIEGLMQTYSVYKNELEIEKRRTARLKLPFLQRLIEDVGEAKQLLSVLRQAANSTNVPQFVSERSLVVLHGVPTAWMNALEMILYEVLGSPTFKDVQHTENTGSTKIVNVRCDSFSTTKLMLKRAIVSATQSPLLLVMTKQELTRGQLGKILGIGVAFAETTLSIQANPVSLRPFVRSTGDVNSFAGAVVEFQYELLETSP